MSTAKYVHTFVAQTVSWRHMVWSVPLLIAFSISAVLHAVMLAIHIKPPQPPEVDAQDTPLEIILVNASTEEAAQNAKAIAQFNLAGGGELEQENVRSSSFMHASKHDSHGNDTKPTASSNNAEVETTALQPQEQGSVIGADDNISIAQLIALRRRQNELLEQAKSSLQALEKMQQRKGLSEQERQDIAQRRQLLLSTLGEIERRVQRENSRPLRSYDAPATVRGVQAIYFSKLKQKIEDKGTYNFPQHNGVKLYGELILVLVVNHHGHVVGSRVMKSSGNPMLDRRAEAIARLAGPFEPFDAELMRSFFGAGAQGFNVEWGITMTFNFAHDNTLYTKSTPLSERVDDLGTESVADTERSQ